MSEIQENTEAKLAAYIDGELEGAERAEIEKLLEQHPNYRRVLDQLRVTRDMLRSLPKESAPPELSEAFNGQLERTVLLEGLGDKRRPALPLNRWPQYAALAAILLLTVGLGVLFYFMLPKGRPAMQVADTRPKAPASTATQPSAGGLFAEEERDLAADRGAGSTGGLARLRNSTGFGGAAFASTEPANANYESPLVLAQNVYQSPQVQELLNTVTPEAAAKNEPPRPTDDALVMVVRTNNPQQVHREVAAYCVANSIAWEVAPPRTQVALNSALLNNSIATNPQPSQQQAQNDIAQSDASSSAAKKPAPDSQTQKQDTLTEQQARRSNPNESEELRGGMRQNASPQAAIGQQNQADQNPEYPPVDNVFIARHVSRRQAQELSETLSRAAAAGVASRAAAADNLPAMANAPVEAGGQAAPAQRSGEFRQNFSYWQSRNAYVANEKQAEAPADKDTTRPSLSSTAASITPTTRPSDEEQTKNLAGSKQQQDQLSARSRDLAPAAPVARREMSKAREFAASANTTRPAGLAATSPSPATAPATAPASDQPVDVVIVVQRATPVEPATQPAATQPSSTQPATLPGP